MQIILLTGPGGAGKTTIANLLRDHHGFTLIDGDHEDTEFFPTGGQWLAESSNLLTCAHEKILQKTIDVSVENERVVVDYIIFGHYWEFINSFAKRFGQSFMPIILFPSEDILIQRDAERTCWTTGPERIRTVRNDFLQLQEHLNNKYFLDTTDLSVEETLATILSKIQA